MPVLAPELFHPQPTTLLCEPGSKLRFTGGFSTDQCDALASVGAVHKAVDPGGIRLRPQGSPADRKPLPVAVHQDGSDRPLPVSRQIISEALPIVFTAEDRIDRHLETVINHIRTELSLPAITG